LTWSTEGGNLEEATEGGLPVGGRRPQCCCGTSAGSARSAFESPPDRSRRAIPLDFGTARAERRRPDPYRHVRCRPDHAAGADSSWRHSSVERGIS